MRVTVRIMHHVSGQYPCQRYETWSQFDTFIPHDCHAADLARMQEIGLEAFMQEMQRKQEVLAFLLEHCNDGRRKTFFMTAVYRLPLEELGEIQRLLEAGDKSETLRERAGKAVALLQSCGEKHGIGLKLRKKQKASR